MADTSEPQFGFQRVKLFKDQPLGTGSYGAVCIARCDELLCAAKIMHPTLFELNDPSAPNVPLVKFEQECRLLSAVKHPNIVQYMGICREPITGYLVLLMELCDESLTRHLENSPGPLPYHTQVSICHDVALALVYLHINRLVHRDLSSNNVLLVPGNRAKVTDFGMSRFMQVNPRITPLTLCPGTQAYMAPETLEEPPQYSSKLDCFSWGVLAIQVATRKFPDPGPRFQAISDPRYPVSIRLPVLEEERRKSHIVLIETGHAFLPLIKKCLSYKEEDRPSAVEICQSLVTLKEASLYTESMQTPQPCRAADVGNTLNTEDHTGSGPLNELGTSIQQLKRMFAEKSKECDVAQKKLEQAEEKERETAAQLVACNQNAKKELQQKDKAILDLKKTVLAVREQLASSDRTSQPHKKDEDNEKQSTAAIEKEVEEPVGKATDHTSLSWEITGAAPQELVRGGAVVLGDSLYCHSASQKTIHEFNTTNQAWSTLPPCKYSYFSLAVVNGLLTTIGGYDIMTSDDLLSLISLSGSEKSQWGRHYNSMPTARCNAAAVCTDEVLVVAGGDATGSNDYLCVVEVMHIESGQWTTTGKLPCSHLTFSAAVRDGHLYLGGGIAPQGKNVTYSCSLKELLHRNSRGGRLRAFTGKKHSMWQEIGNLPVSLTTLVTFKGRLLAIGGQNTYRKAVADVYEYDEAADSWRVFSQMNLQRSRCLVCVFQDNLICIGGQGENVIERARMII